MSLLCRSWIVVLDRKYHRCCGGVCVAMSCVVEVSLLMVLMILWDSVWPMTGKYSFDYFQYQGDVGCVCMLNDWISSNDVICAVNFFYSRFKLKGQCRSEKWEVYLYGYSRFKLKGQCRSEKWKVYLYGDSRFKLKGQCRSEKWEVYLYGDFRYSRFKLKGQCRSEKWEVYLYGTVIPGSS